MKRILLIIIILLGSLKAQCQFERGDIMPEQLYTTTYDMSEYNMAYYEPGRNPWDPWDDQHGRDPHWPPGPPPDPHRREPLGNIDVGVIILFSTLFGAYYLYLTTKNDK